MVGGAGVEVVRYPGGELLQLLDLQRHQVREVRVQLLEMLPIYPYPPLLHAFEEGNHRHVHLVAASQPHFIDALGEYAEDAEGRVRVAAGVLDGHVGVYVVEGGLGQLPHRVRQREDFFEPAVFFEVFFDFFPASADVDFLPFFDVFRDSVDSLGKSLLSHPHAPIIH